MALHGIRLRAAQANGGSAAAPYGTARSRFPVVAHLGPQPEAGA